MRRLFATMAVVVAALALAGAAAAGVEPQQGLTANAQCVVPCTDDGLCQGVLLSGTTQVGTVEAVRGGASFTVVVETSAEWPLGVVVLNLPGIPHQETRSFTPPYPSETTFGPFAVPTSGCIRVEVTITEGVLIDTEALTEGLPAQVTIQATNPGPTSYWNITVSGGTILDGTRPGWCVDVGHTWGGGSVTAQVYSGFNGLPSFIDKPGNWDLVNWVLNNFKPGDTTPYGGIVWQDIQVAMWNLIDNETTTAGLPAGWSQPRVDFIVAAALAYPPDARPYIPPCGGKVAVIFAPVNSQQVVIAQIVAAELPVNCPTPPTASTCFTCCLLGSLAVTKDVNWMRHIPATTEFQICITGPSYATPNCKTFTDGQTLTWTDLLPGEYTVTENPISEEGWTVVGTGSVTVVERETATATVTNNFQDCTLTPGYWKTHSSYGPAPYDATWAFVGENTLFFASGLTWYGVFWTEPRGGNAYYILAHAYMAAKLNSFGGLSTVPEVDAALAWSVGFFTGRDPDSQIPKALRAEAIANATLLDNFNNGIIGPGHCD